MTVEQALLQALVEGEIEVEGRLVDSSNSALRIVCHHGDSDVRAVYKPRRGERPLWDFPSGTLGHREVAASVLDRALGWGLVPVTTWREDAPLGPGSVQAWIDADDARPPVDVVDVRHVPPGWLTVAEGEGNAGEHVCLVHEDALDLRRLCVLDAVMNNADRKGGHVLRDAHGHLAGIDHGLTFHDEPKLRTVLWGWSGAPIDDSILVSIELALDDFDAIEERLGGLLSGAEVTALKGRLGDVAEGRRFPEPEGSWPALPWPAM